MVKQKDIMNEAINRFNIRVYFLLMNDTDDKVLVSDEIIRKEQYTKFPGGGLEYGEGSIECAQREAMEELGQAIEVLSHFYTTDFFMRSSFVPNDQVVSIYYTAKLLGKEKFKTSRKKFDFAQSEKNEESFRWVALTDLDEGEFQFPADKKVVKKMMLHRTLTQS